MSGSFGVVSVFSVVESLSLFCVKIAMQRLLNVERALELFLELDGAASDPESDPDSDFDDDVADPSFLWRRREKRREWKMRREWERSPRLVRGDGGPARGGGGSRYAPAAPQAAAAVSAPWRTEEDVDSAPSAIKFRPRRTPGVQIPTDSAHTPKELFFKNILQVTQ